jgi:uncharacterized damage-inducible protein DinB
MFLKYAKYNKWAGDKTRNVLSKLTNDEYLQDLGEPFTDRLNTIQNLMEHTIQGLEFAFIQISEGVETYSEFSNKVPKKENLTLQMSIDRWEKIDEKLLDYIENNELTGTAIFPIPDHDGVPIEKVDMLLQFFNHTLYHRGQIMLALNHLDKETVGTDYIRYIFDLMFAKSK